jgi:hypothetical protein
MKLLTIALTLAMITPAAAQLSQLPVSPTIPKTMKLYDNRSGEVIGTATLSWRTFYLRDLKGELVGTVVVDKDNKRTFRDPSGNLVDSLSIGGPIKLPDEP